jgi:NADP-dependent 3-hydroxy acid dehydrogenase YdfG
VVQRPEKKSFFVDKVVMITGASSGIGRTLAFWYLNNGARVVLVGRDFDELQEIGE